jgi:antimicrobial peptide system SdpB family protein
VNTNSTHSPWTNVVGLARTVVALGTLMTLLANSADALFRPAGVSIAELTPGFLPTRFSLFMLFGDAHFGWGRMLGIAILAVTASGWRPRLTGVLHWWVAASFATSCIVVDGGDQVAAVLALLLIPVTLTDGRRWHWDAPLALAPGFMPELQRFVAQLMLWTVRIQVAGIYFQASTAKFAVKEWKDGTACYYWFTSPLVGLPPMLERWAAPLLAKPLVVVALTWGTLVLEVGLFVALFIDKRWRRQLLVGGILFHASIIVVHGLVSFFCSMAAALILYLRPIDEPFAWIDALGMHLQQWRRRAPVAERVPHVQGSLASGRA